MDQTLSREESKELMKLLDLDMCVWGNLPLMRRRYLIKCKEYHPDKGGDENLMKRLNELYKKLESTLETVYYNSQGEEWTWSNNQVPTYGTADWDRWWEQFNKDWDDLMCDETLDPEEEEPSTQSTPPKKKRKEEPVNSEFPQCLNDYCSQAIFSNRTMTCFLIHTTKEKAQQLYTKVLGKFQCLFASRHTYGSVGFVFMITPNKHRVSAVNNYCKGFCKVSFINVKGVNKIYDLYSRLCRDPFAMAEESVEGGLKENDFTFDDFHGGEQKEAFNWKLMSDYALEIKCDDVYLLMGLYLDFQYSPFGCTLCTQRRLKSHYMYHEKHEKNAKLFAECKTQKNICQQAVDAVLAKNRVEHLALTREELLLERFLTVFDQMDTVLNDEDSILLHMGGVAWFLCLRSDIDSIVYDYLEMVVRNVPKKRYWLFKGPVNSGKTTVAAALLELCGGKALNINLPFDRINFELGCAIDQFTIVFEDVKGQIGENKDLPSGNGVNNLDNLRDYMDGSVKVNLEKKHMNKRSQIFPPGIVTMNEYNIPITLVARFHRIYTFQPKRHLRLSLEKTPEVMQHRILQSSVTMLLLLIWCKPVALFHSSVQAKVVYWKEVIDRYIGLTEFSRLKMNIRNGKYFFDNDPTPDVLPDDDSIKLTQTSDYQTQ
nr:MAG: large T antigen [Porcine polyomavirus]